MADLIQIGKGTSYTPIVEFQYAGVPQDIDTGVPTITLTRPDGTAGPSSGTVTDLAAPGQYSFVVAAQDEVTWLDYLAVGTVGGQVQKLRGTIEWIGQPLFNISTFRALQFNGQALFSSSVAYPDRQIMEKRTAVLEEFTGILGFCPVQRFAREVLDNTGSGGVLRLANAPAGPLLSVKVAGVAQSITGYSLHPKGLLRPVSGYAYGSAIPSGLSNVVVEYVHGLERPPGKCADMAMMYAAAMLNPSGFSSAVSVSTPDGVSYSYEPSEIGRNNFIRHTGIRDIDRWLNIRRNPARVGLGVA